jgi:uncharacterized protein
MADGLTDYIASKVAARRHPEKGGYGVFATAPIARGELVVVWGGDVVTGEQLTHLPPKIQSHSLQVEEDIYLIPTRGRQSEPGDLINHSCDPNLGLSGQIALVARRDIAPGEEVCFDYAMSDGSPYDEFDCACGTAVCRGRITGDDWRRPDLQARYAGYFAPYLQRRIDRLRHGETLAVRGNGRM